MRWTDSMKEFVRDNIHLTNVELAEKLGVTQAAVENKVRELGLARVFSSSEVDTLYQVWGRKRQVIEAALPRFTWKQIRRKASNIGLPTLNEIRNSVNLFSILTAMGYNFDMKEKWISAGLRVTLDKGKTFKNNLLYVNIDEFWKFAEENPELVDITNLPENILGSPPKAIEELKTIAIPRKRNKVAIKGERAQKLADTFYDTTLSVAECAEMYGVTIDTVRHIAAKHKRPGQKRSLSSVVTDNFIENLRSLRASGLTIIECAEQLGCSKSSVSRGIEKIKLISSGLQE